MPAADRHLVARDFDVDALSGCAAGRPARGSTWSWRDAAVRVGRDRRGLACATAGRRAAAPSARPVYDAVDRGDFARACRRPRCCPPPAPPSGPRSMTQSAVLITSRLCSTTSTVLPASTKSCSTLSSMLNVGKVQAGRRLVEQIERAAGALLHQFAGQLDPLGLAARERGRGLAELEIVEPHVVQRLQLVADLGNVFEVVERLLHVHFQHVGDRLAFEADLQRLAIEAMPLANRASDPDVGQKIHLQPVRAVSLARLAAAAGDVEAESARLVAAGLRLGQLGVQIANLVEQLDVGGRVRARRAADRRLIDGDQLVEMLEPFDPLVLAGLAQRRRSGRGARPRPECR